MSTAIRPTPALSRSIDFGPKHASTLQSGNVSIVRTSDAGQTLPTRADTVCFGKRAHKIPGTVGRRTHSSRRADQHPTSVVTPVETPYHAPSEQITQLFTIAENDFHAAKALAKLQDPRCYNQIMTLSQQSVEKLFKVVMKLHQAGNSEAFHSHELLDLKKSLPFSLPFSKEDAQLDTDLGFLAQGGVQTRYTMAVTKEQAQRALQIAETLRPTLLSVIFKTCPLLRGVNARLNNDN